MKSSTQTTATANGYPTYILKADHKTHRGTVVHIVAQRWEDSGKWLVGEYDKVVQGIVFDGGEYSSLSEICFGRGLDVKAVKKTRFYC